MESKKLYRASIDKKICGVCGGIAHYFGVDSTLVRLITVILFFAGGLSLWVYIIAALIMTESPDF
jgi:phage shock protein C